MNQRGFGLLMYLVLGLAILATISAIIWWADANIATSAGVEKGEKSKQAEWDSENRKERERLDREAAVRNGVTDKREAENAKRYANLDARYRAALVGLRDKSRSDGKAQPLSQAATLIACPDRQADVAGRLERLEVGVLGLLERGDKAIERTITCRSWLEDQLKVKVP